MKQVEVAVTPPYPVYIGRGVLEQRSLWQRHLTGGAVLIVSNETVAPLYLAPLLHALPSRSAPLDYLALPDGEEHKNVLSWQRVVQALVELGATRDATIIALGGGVIGDLAGFAAATYMRGIRIIQVPTTLLAQVDAAVGGKTALNLRAGKNLIGAFHQPAAVLADLHVLASLPEREYRAGLAEAVKYGLIADAEFAHWCLAQAPALKTRLEPEIEYLVHKAVAHKAAIVAADEKEQGARALLNLGHTFAHALETATGYRRFLHGEAVAIGLYLAARLSERLGLAEAGVSQTVDELLTALALPARLPADLSPTVLRDRMRLDKKATTDHLRLILLKALGDAVIHNAVPDADLLAVIEETLIP